MLKFFKDAIDKINFLGLRTRTTEVDAPAAGARIYYKDDSIKVMTNTGTARFIRTNKTASRPSYADNAAALAGGLAVGDEYHTAGVVKVVI